jgi:hypothetical protein
MLILTGLTDKPRFIASDRALNPMSGVSLLPGPDAYPSIAWCGFNRLPNGHHQSFRPITLPQSLDHMRQRTPRALIHVLRQG